MARKRKLRGVEKARKLVRGYQAGGVVDAAARIPLMQALGKVAEFVNIPPGEQLTASPFRSAVSGAIDPGGNIAQLGALLTGVENPNALAAVGLLGGLISPSPTDDIARISKVLTKKGVGSLSELASKKGLTNIKLSSGAELKLGRGNLFIETPKGGTAFAQEAVEKLPGAGEFAALKLGTIEAPGEAGPLSEFLIRQLQSPGFQRGGQVAGKTRATIRVPARTLLQRFQTGGEVSNVIPNLFTGFGGLQANTGAQRGITQQLRQFNPFGGPVGGVAQGTLTGLLQTGLPTDVGALTDVAQARAGRTFGELTGGINEQLGALGLGSSSARTAALARAAGNLSAQVGETGILAGLQARKT